MNLEDLQHSFNRALTHSFSIRKLAMITAVLLLCGILVVFCRALALAAGEWVMMSLTFLPIFLSGGLLLATGIVLVRLYHNAVKARDISLGEVLRKSWELAIGASYFAVPIILTYLVMWMCLGIFFLLREIPGVGDFFGVVLAFGPFLLNFGSLALCLLSLGLLFFVAPAVALRSADPQTVSQVVVSRVRGDAFSNLLFLVLALMPLATVVGFLALAAYLTGSTYVDAGNALHIVLQWFFIMIPFTALLSPAVVFFFNIAAEAHVCLRKQAALRSSP